VIDRMEVLLKASYFNSVILTVIAPSTTLRSAQGKPSTTRREIPERSGVSSIRTQSKDAPAVPLREMYRCKMKCDIVELRPDWKG
jgi:hypothetical protein